MRPEPEFSIVIPLFQEADLVARVVEVIAAQMDDTGRSWELICVDDGSTDATPDLL